MPDDHAATDYASLATGKLMRFATATLVAIAVSFAAPPASVAAITFDWAYVGNVGNAADPETGHGAVAYNYAISKTEVTNAQYTEFLNSVAQADPNGLYLTSWSESTYGGIIRHGLPGSYTYTVKPAAKAAGPNGADYTYADKPVYAVTLLSAMRMANWLHNGRVAGGTENGAYDLSNGQALARSSRANYWIPSEDEWYKAAYFDPFEGGPLGRYHRYPARSSDVPDNNLPAADSGNSANYKDSGALTTGSYHYPLLDVASYRMSTSPFGTYDQGGSLWEWTDTLGSADKYALRGGSWLAHPSKMSTVGRFLVEPGRTATHYGFRIATIPEPTTATLLILGVMGGGMRRRSWDG